MCAQPVRRREKFLFSSGVVGSAEQVVITESPLCYRNRVVLTSDPAVIIQHRDPTRVIRSGILSLLCKRHVVLADFAARRVRVHHGTVVPKTQLAIAAEEVRSNNSAIVME